MIIQLIRHATLRIQYAGKQFLVDPMFSQRGTLPATPNTPNMRPNPLVDLTVDVESLLQSDAILLTHSHRDHFDEEAINLLPQNIPFFCQPSDEKKLEQLDFTQVQAVQQQLEWQGITLIRTGGQHGRGEIGRQMGPVSGFIIQATGEPTLYIAGDTVWCQEVEEALTAYHPEVIVVFAGAAQFLSGGAITMDKEDLIQVRKALPHSKIVVTHMETWNHCLLSRQELQEFLVQEEMTQGIYIPQDGEEINFTV